MNQKTRGQGAIEYLLIIGAAILVVAIVILAVMGAFNGAKGNSQTTLVDYNNSLNDLKNQVGGSGEAITLDSCGTINASGTYNIDSTGVFNSVDPCISITGNNVTLDGQSTSFSRSIAANNISSVTIKNFKFNDASVELTNTTNSSIINNSFDISDPAQNYAAIKLTDAANDTIKDNVFTKNTSVFGSTAVIQLFSSNNNTISDNNTSGINNGLYYLPQIGFSNGLQLTGSSNNTIINNNFISTFSGLILNNSSNMNTFSNNKFDGGSGGQALIFNSSSNNTFAGDWIGTQDEIFSNRSGTGNTLTNVKFLFEPPLYAPNALGNISIDNLPITNETDFGSTSINLDTTGPNNEIEAIFDTATSPELKGKTFIADIASNTDVTNPQSKVMEIINNESPVSCSNCNVVKSFQGFMNHYKITQTIPSEVGNYKYFITDLIRS